MVDPKELIRAKTVFGSTVLVHPLDVVRRSHMVPMYLPTGESYEDRRCRNRRFRHHPCEIAMENIVSFPCARRTKH